MEAKLDQYFFFVNFMHHMIKEIDFFFALEKTLATNNKFLV